MQHGGAIISFYDTMQLDLQARPINTHSGCGCN